MRKPNNLLNAEQILRGYETLNIGGHECVVANAEQRFSKAGNEMLVVELDTASTDKQPSFYRRRYEADRKPNKKWGCILYFVQDGKQFNEDRLNNFIAAVCNANGMDFNKLTDAEFKELGNINEDNIISLSCIALDIDSKENEITMYEMISKINNLLNVYPVLSYCTFSDKDYTKFRLIYELEYRVDVETYRNLYLALQWKFKKYIDPATKNANRIWAGTNKNVYHNKQTAPISFEAIEKLIKAHKMSVIRKEKKQLEELKKKYENQKVSNKFFNTSYIKPEHKEEVLNLLINNIDLREFIPKNLGGRYKRNGDTLTGACVFHGGDNETALVIDRNRYTCFTHCGSGNVITAARHIYNIENFSEVAFKLLNEHDLSIPESYIRRNY